MLKEACVENFTAIPQMIAAGATRIELNSDLAQGGLTPSFGVMKQAILYAHQHGVAVVVMIRPRSGDFVYNETELNIMINDLQLAALLDADAVTFGCLKESGVLNCEQMQKLITLAQELNLEVVMHMAFDQLQLAQQHSSLDWLANHGVKRILTHGGPLTEPIETHLAYLSELITWSKGQITILPGGGITVDNCNQVAQLLGVNQVHGTKIVIK
ncbi:copper homeostasis protein [Lactobacillus bombicola]|uniref:PF03932 family protein CutC n=1 Tax=Lactobacillus bombicola TaxID=1505723 RepID=A0A1I1RDG1_9LACO|nr:copper homeostasis protein CutC [Lactobacillus bombicola]MCO6528123.1 copper homeostasis protein CutC [Lactobacillus sp.]SFD30178.1 copper homeostasis protein [Lactobacillus bombicola]